MQTQISIQLLMTEFLVYSEVLALKVVSKLLFEVLLEPMPNNFVPSQ